jgi:hypothetical protein
MRIDEVINEVEFGAVDRMKQGAKNVVSKIGSKLGSNRAKISNIRGDVKAKGMKAANVIATKYQKWLVQNHPDQPPETLNIEQFKQWMATSPRLKNQTSTFDFLKANPQLQNLAKQSSSDDPVQLDGENKSAVFLNLAYADAQTQPSSNDNTNIPNVKGGNLDSNQQQEVNKWVQDAPDDVLAAVIQAGVAKLQK